MKKNRNLFMVMLLILINVVQLQGQNLLTPGNTWSEVVCFGNCDTYFLKSEGDTLINNMQYQILLKSDDSSQVSWYYETCMRETEDNKVYRWDGTDEILYYDFGLEQGDIFTTSYNDCFIQMQVESIDVITLLNGEERAKINFQSQYESWIEGIGSTFGLDNMGMDNCIFDVYFGLNCFTEDGILKYDDLQWDGCYHVSVGIEEHAPELFQITPNPVSKNAIISFPLKKSGVCEIRIFDVYGRQIDSQKIYKGQQNGELVVSGWPRGIYIATIFSNGLLKGKCKFLVE